MSYAEHGPRIFLAGVPDSGVTFMYGDYVVPRKRSEGRLKLYNSCTDIRAWSPNVLENSRYFRELNEHTSMPGKVVPFNVVMESMIGLTAQAQNELRVVQGELRKYKSLKLTPEQRKYLEGFDEAAVEAGASEEIKIEPIIRPLFQDMSLSANRLAASQHASDAYLSVYFRFDNRFRCNSMRGLHPLLIDTRVSGAKQNANSLLRNNTDLVSRTTSCNVLNVAIERYEQTETCVKYIDASSQTMRVACEMSVQTDEYKDSDDYVKQPNIDSSRDYKNIENVFTFGSELKVNSNPEVCDRSHRRVIIQKDSEIIVLKNELGVRSDISLDENYIERSRHNKYVEQTVDIFVFQMKEDELEYLQALIKTRDEDVDILKRNLNSLQEKLEMMSDQRNDEVEHLCAKLASSKHLVGQLKAELTRRCQVCHLQSQEVQMLRKKVEEVELLSEENESLMRKVRKMECLSKEAESCGIALEQVKIVWAERNMLKEQCREQSHILADKEDEIKSLLTLIQQIRDTANTREVKMNDVVADLRNEIRAKTDRISQCETQLVCMEREVGNLTSMLKSSLNNLDESKIAYEDICEYAKCEHDTCLDVQSALSALKAFIDELEESKLERRNRLQEIDNLKACMACYSQESVTEITNTDFDTGHESMRSAAEDISTSSNYGDQQSSKELVNVQVQSDEVETTTEEFSEDYAKARLGEVISYEEMDRVLATHFKRSINKMHEISAALQGAGDYHAQIVKEHAKQQQELQRKDLEITELRQKVAQQMSQRGEGDCTMQLKKRMLEKEKLLETVINKRDSEIEVLREQLNALNDRVATSRTECEALRNENTDLISARDVLSKENEARSEELKTQRDQEYKLIRQIDELTMTVGTLREEADDIDDMRKKLLDLQTRNSDLTNEVLRTNETIFRNGEVIEELRSKNEQNRIALTDGSIRYDAMITQKQGDIVKLQDENQLLRDRLRDAEIMLARSNDVTPSLRQEGDSAAVRTEIASRENVTMNVESERRESSPKEEAARNTDDQFTRAHEDMTKWPLRDTLCTLPGKIYEKIVRLRGESRERDNRTESEQCRNKEIALETEGEKRRQPTKIYVDKSCQQDEEFFTSLRTRHELNSAAQAVDLNFESTGYKLRFPEKQHEEKPREIKNLIDDVKLRDYEIKNLQECITHLLKEKSGLQDKVKCQVEKYQSRLTLLKKKYDSSLSALRKRHNESVERLQSRFDDIMKVERCPFDAEDWLQSLNLKELTELHNRINILSTHASRESDATRTETRSDHNKEHRFCNKFTLHREKGTLSGGKVNNEETVAKIFNADDSEKVAIMELYSRDVRLKQEQRHCDDREKQRSGRCAESPGSKLDRQREKFIYQCSVHHKLNNGR